MTLGTGTAWVIVESELDALLLAQEAGDVCRVMSMGNAQTRPDQETHKVLKEADLILISLDSDQGGAKEAWGFWKANYISVKRWPVPVGKDPSEARQAGLDLRSWVMANLPDEPEHQAPDTSTIELERTQATEPAPNEATATHESHHATPAPDEGIDQGATRRTVFEPFPDEWKTRFDEGTLERLAIMTVCGGLSDAEVERVLH